MQIPKVSILIAVYNGSHFIAQTLESILKQDYKNFEIVIIDDGSTDDTTKIVQNYYDERIRLIQNKINLGLIFSLNRGLKEALGEYICRIDSDDLMEENRIGLQVEYLDRNTKIDVVGSHSYIIDEMSQKIDNFKWHIGRDNCAKHIMKGYNPVGHPLVMMRKEKINFLRGYDSYAIKTEDLCLWYKIYLSGGHIDNINLPLTSYRVHSKSISKTIIPIEDRTQMLLVLFKQYSFLKNLSPENVRKYVSYSLNKNFSYINDYIKVMFYLTFERSSNISGNKISNFYSFLKEVLILLRINAGMALKTKK